MSSPSLCQANPTSLPYEFLLVSLGSYGYHPIAEARKTRHARSAINYLPTWRNSTCITLLIKRFRGRYNYEPLISSISRTAGSDYLRLTFTLQPRSVEWVEGWCPTYLVFRPGWNISTVFVWMPCLLWTPSIRSRSTRLDEFFSLTLDLL